MNHGFKSTFSRLILLGGETYGDQWDFQPCKGRTFVA